eukprot:TRINITY_DN29855_c0_g1_i1.p2 TRINITY_DN29855_c0_g1~~TRINITY_DN29855_c0_g1_i1.p2  ORF type:complete len:387 (+),score=135.26 TRINITY_DN29855_c0_g1_i1:114-1163(+)
MEVLVEALREGGVLCVTGAGCSTESGIPDYRSPKGSYSRGYKPMTHRQFCTSEYQRRRYWARSFLSYPSFSLRPPNGAHKALYELQARGAVGHVITQNVDGLHHRIARELDRPPPHAAPVVYPHPALLDPADADREDAEDLSVPGRSPPPACDGESRVMAGGAAAPPGAPPPPHDASPHPPLPNRVLDLHGRLSEVVCMGCGTRSSRAVWQESMAEHNPVLAHMVDVNLRLDRSDGDSEVGDDAIASFVVPPCATCGSRLTKPHVVLFGANVPQPVVDEAMSFVAPAPSVLVLGTSLMVYSSWRFVKAALQLGKPVHVVNIGETRADPVATTKVEARVGDVLPLLLQAL